MSSAGALSLRDGARTELLDQLIDFVTHFTESVPGSAEAKSTDPSVRARELTVAAAAQAGATAGALALPPGPLGLFTVVPDLLAVWQIQRQLVSDIAACYGRTAELRRETMIYCLFRHAAAQVVRDLVVRVGERLLLRRSSVTTIERSLQRVGLVVSQRTLTRTMSRWLPIAGAVGVGAYAFFDTMQVGRTAQELFETEGPIAVEE